MPNWDVEPDDAQREFERAAIVAAQGWIDALKLLDEAYEREKALKKRLRKIADSVD